MSCKVSPFRSQSISLRQTLKETEKTFSVEGKPLSSSEMEILSKINIILEDLKELEQNFCKLRQDILKKNTIEGRENSKICAVQGKFISKNYYKTLGEDIEFVSKMFQDQSKKIAKEISSISLISKIKDNHGSSGDNGSFCIVAEPSTPIPNPNSKLPEVPAMKQLKNFEIKSGSGLKEKLQVPFILRAEPTQEVGVPKTLRPEKISLKRPIGSQVFMVRSSNADRKANNSENIAPNLLKLDTEGTDVSPLGHLSMEI